MEISLSANFVTASMLQLPLLTQSLFDLLKWNGRLLAALARDEDVLDVFPKFAVLFDVDDHGMNFALVVEDVLNAFHGSLALSK
jgi:hypothetical protein